MLRVKNIINEERLMHITCRVLRESLEEIIGSHVSHANFDKFSLDKFGSGEGKAPAHGYGVYVAIDPKSNTRYFLQSIRSDHHDNEGNAQAYHYDIEFPDINNNYLYAKYPISEIPQQLFKIKKHLLSLGINLESSLEYNEHMSCQKLLTCVGHLLSSDEYASYRTVPKSPSSAASGLMLKCGIIGMLYYGRSDKMCACIFDPSLVQIKQKTNMRDILGDIQPANDNDRKRVQKKYAQSDFFKQRQQAYDNQPFDYDKYYNQSKYVQELEKKSKTNKT